MHLGQGSGKEHAIKEEHILHALLQAQIFAYNWQKVQAISPKDNNFYLQFLNVYSLQAISYAFLFFFLPPLFCWVYLFSTKNN